MPGTESPAASCPAHAIRDGRQEKGNAQRAKSLCMCQLRHDYGVRGPSKTERAAKLRRSARFSPPHHTGVGVPLDKVAGINRVRRAIIIASKSSWRLAMVLRSAKFLFANWLSLSLSSFIGSGIRTSISWDTRRGYAVFYPCRVWMRPAPTGKSEGGERNLMRTG
jgi:hypothetical protein